MDNAQKSSNSIYISSSGTIRSYLLSNQSMQQDVEINNKLHGHSSNEEKARQLPSSDRMIVQAENTEFFFPDNPYSCYWGTVRH
jgi:hypothetical protein